MNPYLWEEETIAQNPKVIDPDWIASRLPIVRYFLKKKWGLSGMDLEEVTQETMLEALKSFHNYKGLNNAEPGTFLLGIANNVTQTFFRKRGRHQRRSAPLNFADSIGTIFRDEAEASDLAKHLRAKIAKLPKNYIQVLELVFYKGMKEGEAAKVLNLSPDKVYSCKSDAHKRLRKLCLKDPIFRSLFYL